MNIENRLVHHCDFCESICLGYHISDFAKFGGRRAIAQNSKYRATNRSSKKHSMKKCLHSPPPKKCGIYRRIIFIKSKAQLAACNKSRLDKTRMGETARMPMNIMSS
jgi:hypothetical protein